MNHIHRVVWSEHSGTYVAVGETAPRRGKSGGGTATLLAGVLMGLSGGAAFAQGAPPPNTLPTAGQVASGQASLSTTGNRLDITQTSQQAIINWQSFNIGAGAQVNFVQPGATSVALNRVLGSDPSSIFGRLSANGQVFILNPNGVLFGNTARVDVGGLVASTLTLGDADFMAGRYHFTAGRGSVVNQGELSARHGGYIALLAPEVRNEGVVSATLGTVALASGQAITLQTSGLLSVAVDQGALESLIENKHLVKAEDGRVLISARSSDALQRAVIRNDGSIEAKGVRNVGGLIRLEGDVISQTGTIDASSAVADGGRIELRALASDDGGTLTAVGRIDASGQRGGSVLLTGNAVNLLDAQVTASGTRAGGEVLIGGDTQGRNASVPNAKNTTVDAGSLVSADATQSGQGGKVVVWADQRTVVAGSLTARGGASGGDGGFIETSGKRSLDIGGARVDASAPKGANGRWLLDPSDVTIVHGSSGSLAGGAFDPGAPSNIGDTEINAALDGGTDVTIQTTTGSGGSGAIVVNGNSDAGGAVAISNNSGGTRGLSLIADGAIDIRSGANIAGSSGNVLNVSLSAASGNTLSGTIDNRGGTTSLTGVTTLNGTVKNGTLLSLDATPALTSNNGRLDNMTLGGTTLNVSGELHLYNDLTLANGVTVNAGANNWYFNGQDTGQAAGTVHHLTTPGTATLNLAGTNLNTFSVNGQTLQIDSGVTVQGFGSLNQYWGGNSLINAGTLLANTPGQTLYVYTSNFANTGTIGTTAGALDIQTQSFSNSGTANASGGTLALNATNWSNSGTINVDSGSLNLGGTFTVADLTGARYARTGGNVNLTGLLNNTGTSVDIGGSGLFGTGGLTALYGRILNGTVLSSDSTILTSNSGRLDNVTLGGTTLNVSGELHIYNDLTLANGVTVNASANNWYFNGQDTGQAAGTVHHLTTPGTATLNLAGTNLNTFSVNGQTLQIDSGVTVQGFGSLNQYWGGNSLINAGTLLANTPGQSLYVYTSNFSNVGTIGTSAGALDIQTQSFTNSGTANASGGTLALNASNWSNSGTINANSGTLNLGGTFTVADLTGARYARNGGNVNLTGLLDNTGTSVDIGGSGLFGTGGLTALYGRVLNGTVLSGDGTVLTSNSGRLDNVTLGGTTLNVSGELHLYNDLTLASGVTVNAGANNWYFNGQDTGQAAGTVHHLTTPGTATLNLGGTNFNTFSVNGQTLQIDSGVTVQGFGSLNQYWGGNSLINAGTLLANTPGQSLYVYTSNFSNVGTIGTSAGALDIQTQSFTNSGTANASGGTLALNATNWSNSGTINVDSGSLNLGGTFTVADLTGARYARTGGNVNITGLLDNTGTSVDIGGSGLFGTGGLTALYGRILNGTVLSSDSTTLTSNSGRLDNVTLGGTTLNVSGELHIYNDLTLANGTTVHASANNWYFNGQDTGQAAGTVHRLTTPGTATLNLAGTNLNTFSVNGQTLQIESGMTIQGYGSLNQTWGGNTVINTGSLLANTNGQGLYVYTSNFSNVGTIGTSAGALDIQTQSFSNSGTANASGGTLALNATSWSNTGTINANSGTLNLGGTFTVADLTGARYARSGGNVNLTGLLDNTGTSVDVGGSGLFGTGGLTTLYGRVLNGTVLSGDSTVLTSNSGRLDNVTLGGTSLNVSGELHLYNDLTLANGVTVNAGPNNWYFNGQDTGQAAGTVHHLTTPGTATLNLGGTNLNTFSVNGQTLQIGSGMTIQGYGSLNETWGGNTVINAGRLIANTSGQALYIHASNFGNSGTVQADAGATFYRGSGFVNTGNLAGSGTIAVGTGASRLVNQGSINPGGTGVTGTLTISGDLQMATGASLNAELGGTSAGQFDRLVVTGALSGDTGTAGSSFGNLALTKINGYGYVNLSGDTFSLLSAASGVNSGSFDAFNLGRSYATPSYGATEFSLLAAPRVLSVVADTLTKTYGAADPTFTYAVTGFDPATADNASTALSGVLGRAAGKDVGSYAYVLGSLTSTLGYAISFGTGTSFSITPAPLTLTANNASKVYDGGLSVTTTAAISSGTLFSGDTLTGGSFAFTNKNAGSGNKTVTVSGVTVGDGVHNGNYTVSYVDNTTSTITPYIVSATGSRSYDATTGVAGSGLTLGSLVGGDTLTVSGSGVAIDKNVGNAKTVATGTLVLGDGTGLASNYSLSGSGISFNITPRATTVSGITASTKVYDATTTANLIGAATANPLLSDDVSVGGTVVASFADKNVGTAKAVTVTGYTLAGTDAANYVLTQPTGLTANITQANLAVTGLAVSGKVYDATTTASLTGTAGVSALLSDVVSVTGTGSASFVDKNAGTSKAVTVTGFTLSGADAGNYALVQPTGVTANITQASLAVSGVTASSKVYDATTTTSLIGTAAVNALSSDNVVVAGTGTGSFANKNVGTNKAVTVTGYTLAGADAANYAVAQPAGLMANVTQANLAVSGVTASSKVYDATTTASLVGTASVNVLSGDSVFLSTGTGSFADKNVGTGKAVTVTGFTLTGTDAANYVLSQPAGLTADVTQASLAVSGVTASNKVYDATTTASLGGTALVSALSGDSVSVTGAGAGSVTDKNVGSNKAVTVTGYSLVGTDAGNYTVVQPVGVTASITTASLAITGVAASSKVYDASTTASFTGTAAVGALLGDDVTVAGTGTGSFVNKNVGSGKAVAVTGFMLAGADAMNYVATQPTGLTANITQANLVVTGVTASSKVYDATTTASLGGTASVGALSGDDVSLSGTGTGSFATKNAGTNKAVTVTGYTLTGADAGNYLVLQPGSVTANISPANLAITGVVASNKVYDATTVASVTGTATVNALAGDEVTVAGPGSGNFADKNVGTGKAVLVSGYTLSGADASNYTVMQPSGLAANVTTATLAVSGVMVLNKVYDATTVASLSGTAVVSALGNDSVTVAGVGRADFANADVEAAKPVSVSGFALSGVDAGNYALLQPTGLRASIMAAAPVEPPPVPIIQAPTPQPAPSIAAPLVAPATVVQASVALVDPPSAPAKAAPAPAESGGPAAPSAADNPATGMVVTVPVAEGTAFTLAVPPEALARPDAPGALTLGARAEGGGELPAWLKFDPVSRTFSGTVPADVQTLKVLIATADGTGKEVQVAVTLRFVGADKAL